MKIKNTIVDVISVLFGFILLFTAYNHIANPDFYAAMIPPFISDELAHYLSVVSEALIGIMLIHPKFRKQGILFFTILMIIFLPIHLWDVLRENHAENPTVPTMAIAVRRFIIQLVLIALGFWMWKVKKDKANRSGFRI